MVQPIFLPKLERFVARFGTLPSSYREALSYEEQTLWICSYIEKTLLPALNENSEALAELQNLFVELTNYVNNYFEDLDVQEEINNKLEDMAQSGELEEIIAAYLNTNSYIVFNTVAEMKSSEILVDGSFCQTLGYHSIDDGGAGTYKIREITNQDVIDEGSLIAVNNIELVAELITNDVYVKQFGAVGDDETDDATSITNAINYGLAKDKKIIINKGTYLIDSTISIINDTNTKNVVIEGEGLYSTEASIIHSTAPIALYINYGIPFIKNVTFKGNDTNIGIKLGADSPTTVNYAIHWGALDHIVIRNFETGLILGNVFDISFKDIDIFYTKYGVVYNKNLDKSYINNINFIRLHIENLEDEGIGIDFNNGRNVADILFNSLHIETRNLKAKAFVFEKVAGCIINNLYLAMQNNEQSITDYTTAITINDCRDIQVNNSSITISPQYQGASSDYPMFKIIGNNYNIQMNSGYWAATTTTATNIDNFIDKTEATTEGLQFNNIKINNNTNEYYNSKLTLSRSNNIASTNDFNIAYRTDNVVQLARNVQSDYSNINKNNGRVAIASTNELITSSLIPHRIFEIANNSSQQITTYGRTNLNGAYIILANFNDKTRIAIFTLALPDTTIRFPLNDGSMYTSAQGTDARINIYISSGNVTIENKSGYDATISILPIFNTLN